MNPTYHELPRQIVALLKTIGPLQEFAAGGYHFSISVVLRADEAVAGFLVTQRLAELETPSSPATGLQFQVPVRPATGSETTHVFTESLSSALSYTEREPTVQS